MDAPVYHRLPDHLLGHFPEPLVDGLFPLKLFHLDFELIRERSSEVGQALQSLARAGEGRRRLRRRRLRCDLIDVGLDPRVYAVDELMLLAEQLKIVDLGQKCGFDLQVLLPLLIDLLRAAESQDELLVILVVLQLLLVDQGPAARDCLCPLDLFHQSFRLNRELSLEASQVVVDHHVLRLLEGPSVVAQVVVDVDLFLLVHYRVLEGHLAAVVGLH
mmetsp:Transcript_31393/g.48004  ORF Transcript_31393/g.48004 Transcript_31393/m.48004 type:complete len:217 (+) Transcript_31393:693-1343(+)